MNDYNIELWDGKRCQGARQTRRIGQIVERPVSRKRVSA